MIFNQLLTQQNVASRIRLFLLMSSIELLFSFSLTSVVEWLNSYIKNHHQSIDSTIRLKIQDVYDRERMTNPFKSLVLSILSAYDVNNMHEFIINSIDDLLWLRLAQIVFPNSDLMTLNKLQKLVYNEGSESNFVVDKFFNVIFVSKFRWKSKFIQ